MTSLATLDGVTKRYGGRAVVDDLSLDIPEGAVTGLLGPNGAGKTTAIRMLLGLAAPSAGDISLLGASPGADGFAGAVRAVGSLIEGPALYGRASARDNMRIEVAARALDVGDDHIDGLLDFVGLTEHAGRPPRAYSLGMRQRLGLALALLGTPRLVVLDEPTNGLDPAGIAEIRELIAHLPERGTSVLVSSHLLSEVQLMCDRAVIIHRGRHIAEGTIADLIGSGPGGYTVEVAPHERETAIRTLRASGLQPEPGEDGVLTVSGDIPDGSVISRALAGQDIHVRALTPHSASLEDVFLALTADDPPPPPPPGARVGEGDR